MTATSRKFLIEAIRWTMFIAGTGVLIAFAVVFVLKVLTMP